MYRDVGLLTVIAGLAGAIYPACAEVVDLCQSDDQAAVGTSGMNLSRALQSGGRIAFQCGGPATIRITRLHEIAVDTTIDGGGQITFDGGGKQDMFVGSNGSATLRLENLTLRGARHVPDGVFDFGWGGAIRGNINVVVVRSTIQDSTFPILLHHGSLRVERSVFLNNEGGTIVGLQNRIVVADKSRFESSAIPLWTAGSSVSISDTEFSNSEASELIEFDGCQVDVARSRFANGRNNRLGGPAGALNTWCATTISETEFVNNVGSDGGGMYVRSAAPWVKLRSVKFANNTAVHAGGAIALEPSASSERTLEVRYGIFKQNQASLGGAIDLGANRQVKVNFVGSAVDFSENVAALKGGAIRGENASVGVARGIFVDNQAGEAGGAVHLQNFAEHTLTFANALFARNRARTGGSAVYAVGVDFVNSTIASNFGSVAITGFDTLAIQLPPAPWRDIRFVNSIVSNNEGGNCGTMAAGGLILVLGGGEFRDGGNNLQFPGGECGKTIRVSDPHLDSMYVPVAGSPALGAGNNDICMKSPISARDVFGQSRPRWVTCSIGAVEGDIEHLVRKFYPLPGSHGPTIR
jgi:predicted outer membrane repeat protein